MQECMNCGGPVADDDSHCTTCGLARGLVIYGERPWSDGDSVNDKGPCCWRCGDPLDLDDEEDLDADDDQDNDICTDCRLELEQAAED